MSDDNGAQPPAVVEAEMATLGAAMCDPAALRWVLTNLGEEDFYRPAHRTVYRLLAQLSADGQPVSEVAVLSGLRHGGALDGIGGAPYVHSLVAAVDAPAAVGWHGRQVDEMARLRRLIDAGRAIVQLGMQPGQAAEQAEAKAFALVQRLERAADRVAIGPAAILAAMVEAADGQGALPWGLEALDRVTGGLRPGHLTVVASRPGVGKSSLGLQVAAINADRVHVAVASYEMSRVEIGQHHLALYGNMPLDQTIKVAATGSHSWLEDAYRSLDLTVLDGQPDLERLLADLYAIHAEHPLKLLLVDYLQLVPVQLPKGANREQHVAAVPRALKLLGQRLHIPVLALAQLRRIDSDRRPTLADLRESGAIEQDADEVVLLHRDEDDPNVATAHVAKNRMGPTGMVELAWRPKRTMFADRDYGDAPPPSQSRLAEAGP